MGMTKAQEQEERRRDMFAAAALTGLVAVQSNESSEEIAALCYMYADSMVAERDRRRK